MHAELVHPTRAKGIHTRVVPNIAAGSPVLAKLEVVEMGRSPTLKNEDQLVLAAIKRALAGGCLGPHAKIFQFIVGSFAGGTNLNNMPPVAEHEVD